MIDHTQFVDEEVVRSELQRECQRCGSQVNFANRHGFGEAYISKWLSGAASPSRKLLAVLGFERCPTFYRRIEAPTNGADAARHLAVSDDPMLAGGGE